LPIVPRARDQQNADSQFVQDEEIVTVAIIGAGAAGLAAWCELKSAGINAVLLEARDRIGGRVLTDRSIYLPVELGAEFVHGEPPAIWSILREAQLEVVQSCSGDPMVLGEEGLRPCPKYWEIIEKVDQQIDLTRDMAYDRFLERAQASPFEKLLSRSHVEGFNAAHAELISASAIAIGDRATPLIARRKQFRIVSGYGSLIDWLAADVPRELIRLQTVVREIRRHHQIREEPFDSFRHLCKRRRLSKTWKWDMWSNLLSAFERDFGESMERLGLQFLSMRMCRLGGHRIQRPRIF
jgi:hypothetical protein